MSFKEVSAWYLEPLSQWAMIVGIVCLVQPWSLWLHQYGITTTLVGLAGFIIFSHIKPDPDEE
ncbi:MAG: hypothetical protein WD036_05125 [Bauldia sp.]